MCKEFIQVVWPSSTRDWPISNALSSDADAYISHDGVKTQEMNTQFLQNGFKNVLYKNWKSDINYRPSTDTHTLHI